MLDRKRYEDKEATTVNAWDTAYLISATRQSGYVFKSSATLTLEE